MNGEKKMKYTYQKVQFGYWGNTPLKNKNGDLIQKTVTAEDRWNADRKVGADKKLANGDYQSWILIRSA